MRVSRKGLLAGVVSTCATSAVIRYPADAAEFDFKLSTDNPPSQHMTVRLVEAAGKIKQASNGRLDIRVFPSQQLGATESAILQVRSGAIEMCSALDSIMANMLPVAGISAVPFAFANADEGVRAMAGPLGKHIHGQMERLNLHAFTRSWNPGLRQMINALRPIVVPDDLKGMKIRSAPGPIDTALFKALGASPSPIAANEMFVALQTHLVDGTELPIASVESYKMYEVQKYVSYTNHMWTPYTILVSANAWLRLPRNLRDIVDQNINEAASLDSAEVARLESTLEGTLRDRGMVFNKVDTAPFREVLRKAGLYTQWRQAFGADAWALLEKSVGKLA